MIRPTIRKMIKSGMFSNVLLALRQSFVPFPLPEFFHEGSHPLTDRLTSIVTVPLYYVVKLLQECPGHGYVDFCHFGISRFNHLTLRV